VTNWEQIAAEAAWVSAILALMAFVAAAIAVAVTLSTNSAQQRTLELQRKQFEEQQRQARREQAAKVSFFVEANNDGQFELKVINASDYPIHGAIAVLAPRNSRATAAAFDHQSATNGAYSVHNEVASGCASAPVHRAQRRA
jgi:type II secretory pathway pseudopilin PulG